MRRLLALFRTLRGRLVLLVCFATLPALLFTLYAASNERTAALQRIRREATLLAALAAREHAHQLEGARTLLRRLSPLLDGAAPGASAPCPELLPPLLAGYPQFTTIGILAADGALLCTAHPAPPGVTFAGNVALRRALASRDVEVGEYTIGPVVDRPVLHLAHAVRDAEGVPRRVLFVGLDLRWLEDVVQQADLPGGYALLIVDREGRVLGRSDRGAGTPSHEANRAELARVVRDGRAATLEHPGGDRRFVVPATMPGIPGVSIVASLPYARVREEATHAFYRTLAALALLTVLTMACVLFAAEISVLRVVRALARAARRFGAGDLAAHADVPPAEGELGDLARAFQGMAEGLAARQREAEAIQAQLRALSQRLAVAKETEAGRIARELHDELGQILTSVKMDVTALERAFAPRLRLAGADREEALPAAIAEIHARLDAAVGSIRRISADLRPPVLDRLGLGAALEAQARDLEQRTGLAIVLDVDLDEPVAWLEAITLHRIVGEALTNVVRHADATAVTVDVRQGGGAYVLRIEDDGRGISAAEAEEPRSLGIAGMRERCLLVGGSFEVRGEAGRGTTILVRIPRQEGGAPDAARAAR